MARTGQAQTGLQLTIGAYLPAARLANMFQHVCRELGNELHCDWIADA